jgi:hypothetical protein
MKDKTREEWINHFRHREASGRVSEAIDEIMRLQAELTFARRAVALFSSMILAGEEHSGESLEMLQKAMGIKQ